MLKIPFGKDKISGLFYDAGAVPNGRKCNCKCNECGNDLEAVHPKLFGRKNYFRHVSNDNCTGGLESLFHLVAKQILKANADLVVSDGINFNYDKCDIETPRFGKRPDAFVSNESKGLIVEIFFSHRVDPATLELYLANNQEVLEIDISIQKKELFSYDYLAELILHKASRTFFQPKKEKVESFGSSEIEGWGFLGIGLLLIGGFFLISRQNSKSQSIWGQGRKKW